MSDPLGGLPQAPPPSEGYSHALQRGAAPPQVVNAVRLMLLGAALGLISVIVLLLTKDDFKKAVRDNTPNASDSTINTAFGIGIVIGIVFLVLYVLLAFQVRNGKNWARIVTWVFAGLGVLGGVSSLAQAGTTASKAFSLIGGLIDLVIIVLLAMVQSNRYFKPRY